MYPIAFGARFEAKRSRLTTFFRLILVLPWMLWVALYGLAAFLAVIVAWFALVITARYPRGLYDFIAGFVRLAGRVNGFYLLLTDAWPPFHGNEDDAYPVRVAIGPPQASYSRAKAFFRMIVGIPVYVIQYFMVLMAEAVAILSWLIIVITGKQIEALHNVLKLGIAYQARSLGYFMLLTETWPPISEDGGTSAAPAAPPPVPDPTPSAPAAEPEQAS